MTPLTSSQESSYDSSPTELDSAYSSTELVSTVAFTTLWCAFSYSFTPPPRTGCLCCCGKKVELKTPITDGETWRRNIEQFFLSLAQKQKTAAEMMEKLQKKGLKTTAIPERIAEADHLYGNKPKFIFLSNFQDVVKPQDFCSNYLQLSTGDRKRLRSLIGGEQQLDIVFCMRDGAEALRDLTRAVLSITEMTTALEKLTIRFSHKQLTLIPNIKYENILSTFRAFLSEELRGKEGYISVNRQPLRIPDLVSSETGEDSASQFLAWLSKKIGLDDISTQRILKALSFSAFAPAHMAIRERFPFLFHEEFNKPAFKVDSKQPTRFSIEIDEKTNAFTVTQNKLHAFFLRPKIGEIISLRDFVIGQVDVHLQLFGNCDDDKYSGTLSFHNLTFAKEADLATRARILEPLLEPLDF